jgi:hypothetical protein
MLRGRFSLLERHGQCFKRRFVRGFLQRREGLDACFPRRGDRGGALIFEGEPTFVDGRADRLFQNGVLPEIAQTKRADGEDVLFRQLDKYDIGWTILAPDDGRLAHLDRSPEWTRVYEDEFAVIHIRERSGN